MLSLLSGLAPSGALGGIDVTYLGKAGAFGLMCAFPFFLAGHSTVGWHHLFLILGWVAAIVGLSLGWISVFLYIPLARAAVVAGRGRGDDPSASVEAPASPAEEPSTR